MPSITPRLGLTKPDVGDTGWGVTLNDDMDLTDAGVALVGHAHSGTYVSFTDVTAYGATGNGTTDDTVAIQAAIDVFKGNNSIGGTVYFPRGTYRITAPLQLSVGGTNGTSHFSVRLLGAGPAGGTGSSGVAAIKGVSRIKIDGAINGFEIGNNSLTEFNGPWFENLVIFDNNGTATGGIKLTQVDRWKVQDCTFWNFQAGYGIYTKHTGSIPDPLVQNTWFIRCQTGILIQRGDFLKVDNCTFEAQISGTSAVQAGYRGIVADTSGNLDTLRVVDSSFRNCEIPLDFSAETAGEGQEITNCRFEVFTTAIKLSTSSKDVVILGGAFNNNAVGTSGTCLSIPAGALRTRAFLGQAASVTTVLDDSGSDTVFFGVGGFSTTDTGGGVFTLPTKVALRQGVNTLTTANSGATLQTERYVMADATAGPMTLVLPDNSTITRYGSRRGQAYTIKKADSTTNAITISRTSSQKIDGAAADYVLRTPGEWVTLVAALYPSNAVSWIIAAKGIQTLTRDSATQVTLADDLNVTEARNLLLGTTTGSKIGTSTSQKLGFWNATPVIQPTNATPLRKAMIDSGVVGSGTAIPEFQTILYVAGQTLYYYCSGSTGTGTSVTQGNNTLRLLPVFTSRSLTITKLGAEITLAGEAGSTLRLGIYADNGNGYPGALILDAGTIDGTSATVQEVSVSSLVLPAGLYWIGSVVQGAPTTQPTVRTVTSLFATGKSTIPSSNETLQGYSQTGVTGALSGADPFTSTITGVNGAARLFWKAQA